METLFLLEEEKMNVRHEDSPVRSEYNVEADLADMIKNRRPIQLRDPATGRFVKVVSMISDDGPDLDWVVETLGGLYAVNYETPKTDSF
ncbi:MAG: hypothetical protein V1716_05625 [Candidatus Uhrbacteria bacterium]